MENQISTGNQNTHEVEQSPISQPIIPQEKPKINYWMISTIILLLIVGVMSIVLVFTLQKNKTSVINNDISSRPSSPTNTTNSSVQNQLRGKLAFIRDDNLWLINNGIEKQLTSDAIPTEIPYQTGLPKLWYSNPQISPDGTKIVYLKNINTDSRTLVVSDIDGKNAHQLVNDVAWMMPILQWSNDSQKVYYPSLQESETIVVRSVNITTGKEQEYGQFTLGSGCGGGSDDIADHLSAGENITNFSAGVRIFDLSPQNNYVVHTNICTGTGLGVLDLSTKQDRLLDAKAMRAIISPDSLNIAAVTLNNIVIFEARSGKIDKTYQTSESPLVLLWGTDGKTIFYSSSKLEKYLDFDDKLALDILGSSPAHYRVNLSTIWKLSLDNGKSEKITDFEAHYIKPIFSSNQKLLVIVVENANSLYNYISQQKTKENMAKYYPNVNIAEVDLSTLSSVFVANKTQESSYSIK